MKIRNFIVKIYEKPHVYKIQAKDKKIARREAMYKYRLNDEEKLKNIHEIKVINDTDAEFYSSQLINAE